MRILLVDDDPKLRDSLARGLSEQGIECRTAADAPQASSLLRELGEGCDLILLDVMLPGASGWDFLRELREVGDATPVIFLTARQAVEERIRGLRLGADDYVIKPFAFGELLARIESVRRRRSALASIQVGDLRLDLVHRRVERAGRRIEVSQREFELLQALAEQPGRVLERSDLLARVWGIEHDPGTNLVDVTIGRLRRRIDSGFARPLVQTVIGRGYRLGESPQGSA